MTRTVAVVPHSHWDREWYDPFETYRVRLVSMMDQLVDLIESDSGFEFFHLDGQVALLDDYLAVRPQQQSRVTAQIAAGRLSVGPWYVLMDEFCVSAETIVRNLQLGLHRSAFLAGPSGVAGPPVGYLPDMFGHVAQMPQILDQAGMAHAVVWRGVPSAIGSSAFSWVSPDGSTVRAEYLPVGYAAGAFLPKEPEALLRRIDAYEREVERFVGPDGAILLLNGGDHQNPQAWVPDLLDQANQVQDRFHFSQSTLAAYLEKAPVDGLPAWEGELRSGARAPLLMGVLSNRVDIKQAAARVETTLERRAEPLATLWLPPELWPGDELERAWLEVIRNSAHDSICGCSADEVGRAVLARYDSARSMAEAVEANALSICGVATARAGTVVVNPLPYPRSGVVEMDIKESEAGPGAQMLHRTPAGTVERGGTGTDLARILAQLAGEGWLGPTGRGVAARVSDGGAGGLVIEIEHDASRAADPAMAAVMAEAWARAGAGRDHPLTVRVVSAATQRVAAYVSDVPGWGWQMLDPAAVAAPVTVQQSADGSVAVDNGAVSMWVDPDDGTFSLDGVAGQNRLVDEGDEGDTYNYSPSADRPVIDSPSSVRVEVIEGGPVRAVVRVDRVYAGLGRVISDLTVCAGRAAVEVATTLDHRTRDHRLRATFALASPAEATVAECAFATVTRSGAEGGPQEPALATFPSRRFVTAADTTLTHQGLLEHELIDGGRSLAITLLRATGVLARPAPPARPVVAGPPVALRDTQLPGPQTFRYGLARRCGDPWRLADEMWTPLATVRAQGGGPLPESGSRLEVTGARVSALRRVEGRIEIRMFNPTDQVATVEIPGHSGDAVDLTGRVVTRWESSTELAPWALATLWLDRESLDD